MVLLCLDCVGYFFVHNTRITAARIEVQEDTSVLKTFQGTANNRPVFDKSVERLRLTKQSRAVMCENDSMCSVRRCTL